MFIRTVDGFLDEKKNQLRHNSQYVNCNKSDKRKTYNAVILRFDVEGMGDVGPGKFLIMISGSLKGDKLLYDEVAIFTWRKNIQLRNH